MTQVKCEYEDCWELKVTGCYFCKKHEKEWKILEADEIEKGVI